MKHLQPIFSFLFAIFCFLLSLPVAAQTLSQDLARFAETPAVPGYEQPLAAEIRAQMGKLSPQSDNMGYLYVTLGSRETSGLHRLIVAPMDEPGYVVSGITDDGYLRVQRLPQTAPHPLFDLLHAAQPVVIHTRKRKWVPGVVAGLSTHLQPGRQNVPRGAHPDEIYIDIGASSAAEVHQAGVDLLDPIALDRKLYAMGFGRMTAPAVGRPLRLRGAGGTAAADRPSKAARQANGCVCHPAVGRRARARPAAAANKTRRDDFRWADAAAPGFRCAGNRRSSSRPSCRGARVATPAARHPRKRCFARHCRS